MRTQRTNVSLCECKILKKSSGDVLLKTRDGDVAPWLRAYKHIMFFEIVMCKVHRPIVDCHGGIHNIRIRSRFSKGAPRDSVVR